jgi:hypothetical protein
LMYSQMRPEPSIFLSNKKRVITWVYIKIRLSQQNIQSGNNPPFLASDEMPEKTGRMWVSTKKPAPSMDLSEIFEIRGFP